MPSLWKAFVQWDLSWRLLLSYFHNYEAHRRPGFFLTKIDVWLWLFHVLGSRFLQHKSTADFEGAGWEHRLRYCPDSAAQRCAISDDTPIRHRTAPNGSPTDHRRWRYTERRMSLAAGARQNVRDDINYCSIGVVNFFFALLLFGVVRNHPTTTMTRDNSYSSSRRTLTEWRADGQQTTNERTIEWMTLDNDLGAHTLFNLQDHVNRDCV